MTEAIRRWDDAHFYLSSAGTANVREQLIKVQQISKLLRALSDASQVDGNGDRLQDILTGLSLGNLSQRHKWRILYDTVNDRFLVQRNTGTDASKVWSERFRIASNGDVTTTGALTTTRIQTTSGGLVLSGDLDVNGFYIRDAEDISTSTLRVGSVLQLSNNHRPGYVWIATKTANLSPVIDFPLSHYSKYVVELEQVAPVTDAVSLTMQVSTNGGLSFLAAGYATAGNIASNFGPTLGAVGTSSQTSWNLIGDGVTTQDNNVGSAINGEVKINARGGSVTQCRGRSQLDWVESIGIFSISTDVSLFLSPGAQVNTIRFRYSSGNISSGTFRLYGIRES